MTRERAIERFLRHIANDFLRRAARGCSTDAEAAATLKMHCPAGGYFGPDGWWSVLHAGGRGVAYGDGSAMDEPTDIIPWSEIARAARRDGEQLHLEVGV